MDKEIEEALKLTRDDLLEFAQKGRPADVAREDPRATWVVTILTNRSSHDQIIIRPDSTSQADATNDEITVWEPQSA